MLTIPREILRLEQARSLGEGQLASLIADPDSAIAARAALALGRTKQENASPSLVSHLEDRRPAVRAMSAYALGLLAKGAAVRTISRAAGADPSSAVRVAALDAIGRYEAASALRPIDEASAAASVAGRLASDPDPIVRGKAAISLNFFAEGAQGLAATIALERAMRRERANAVRERVMWTIMRRYANKVRRETLLAGLSDPDEVVRIEAVRALGRLKNSDAVAALKPMLNDRSWRVQEQAGEAILANQGKPATISWKEIPPYVHVPKTQVDALASLAPVPWPVPTPAAAAPSSLDADLGQALTLRTAEEIVSPAKGAHPRLRFVTTKGNFYVALYPEWAPLTVENFLNLGARGFLNDNRWFRIVPDFVVQTGEQDDKNSPGPGYSIGAEENPLEQDSYVLSMGLNYDDKGPQRDSAGSEYYFTLSPQYHLDNDFTVFGRVMSGFDVLGRLVESDRVIRVERVADVVL
jgi:cyclophilin family peptidyl-prolyl cis-trans isomerase/HEAT repeat protein